MLCLGAHAQPDGGRDCDAGGGREFVCAQVLAEQVEPGVWQSVLSHLALFDQMHGFARGVVDTRAVVLHASLTFFFLFLTLRAVESRRWR